MASWRRIWEVREVSPGSRGAADDDAEDRDAGLPQRLARRPQLADVPAAERTVEAAQHGEENGPAAKILGELQGALGNGIGQLEVRRSVARAEWTVRHGPLGHSTMPGG
jgi:hypothetical protein